MLEGNGIISRGRFHWETGLCWVIYVGDEVDEAIVPHELGLMLAHSQRIAQLPQGIMLQVLDR